MRLLGLLGGMSWESTAVYYRLINEMVSKQLGGLHSAKLLVHSVDFAEIAELQRAGDWEHAGAVLAEAAMTLERAGADAIVLCTNTMHHVASRIERDLEIPLIHIVDPTADALSTAGVRRVGLVGTRFTMELPFWRERLAERAGIELCVPSASDRETVHRIIYEELCVGRIEASSRARYVEIIDRLASNGAQAVVLGCTEIGLLISARDSPLPVFDTTTLHARAAVHFALH